jgi:hypothetical protein
MPPAGSAIVLLLLVSGLIGFAAGLPTARRGAGVIALFLIGGQAAGHLTLTFAAGHVHDLNLSPAMVLAHLLAAFVCAVLIAVAERVGAAAATRLRELIRIAVPIEAPRVVIWARRSDSADRVRRPVYLRYRGNRAPPVACAA